jgi:translation initiation factor 2B subunit (eIF-2B alpha/beta/delta family)
MQKSHKEAGSDGMNEFIKSWHSCPSCQQEYKNKLSIDIATKFVSFVRRQYPDNTKRQVEALYVKLAALQSMLGRLQPVQKIAGVTVNVILSLIDRMKADAPPLSRRYSQFEANTLGFHGRRIAYAEGTKESARRAVTHFEKQLEVYKAIGDDEGIAVAKGNRAIAKSKYEGGNNN